MREANQQLGRHPEEPRACAASRRIDTVVPAKAGTHTPRIFNWNETLQQSLLSREHGGYGSPPSRGRRCLNNSPPNLYAPPPAVPRNADPPARATRRNSPSRENPPCDFPASPI